MAVSTLTVGPGTLNIGEPGSVTAFSSQVTKCAVTPKVDTGDPVDVLSGEQVAGDRTETFTLDGTLLQDLGAGTSVVEWLWEHAGETHDFEYVPRAGGAGTKGIRGQIQVEAVTIGGDVKAKATSDFSFTVIGGRPELFDAADAELGA